jgi:hypothetical protein
MTNKLNNTIMKTQTTNLRSELFSEYLLTDDEMIFVIGGGDEDRDEGGIIPSPIKV